MITLAIASARAPSVPGWIGIHSSALLAVRERRGSMTTTLTLFGLSRRIFPHIRRLRERGFCDSRMPAPKARI